MTTYDLSRHSEFAQTEIAPDLKVGERHIITDKLVNRLMVVPEGETVLYSELAELVQQPVQAGNPAYQHLRSALFICRAKGRDFKCNPNAGYRRLKSEEIPGIRTQQYVSHARVMNEQHAEQLKCVDPTKLQGESSVDFIYAVQVNRQQADFLDKREQSKLRQANHDLPVLSMDALIERYKGI